MKRIQSPAHAGATTKGDKTSNEWVAWSTIRDRERSPRRGGQGGGPWSKPSPGSCPPRDAVTMPDGPYASWGCGGKGRRCGADVSRSGGCGKGSEREVKGFDDDSWQSDPRGRPCAFVVTLFGNHPGYCVDAAVLGLSLKKTRTRHRMVLLHTEDVDPDWVEALGRVGWETRLCKHLECKTGRLGSFRSCRRVDAHIVVRNDILHRKSFRPYDMLTTWGVGWVFHVIGRQGVGGAAAMNDAGAGYLEFCTGLHTVGEGGTFSQELNV